MSSTKSTKSDTLESSKDYFCNDKQNNIASTSFETLNPLDIICYEEDAEEFELFHTSEETYISDK